jgi:uncharacterized protein (DUF1697 family)
MPRYVAFLRGVSPVNAKMADLRGCFEAAGFANVKTILSSGNVAFDARSAADSLLEQRAEAAMQNALGRKFYTIVRAQTMLQSLLSTDPYAEFTLAPNAKRVVSFLRQPSAAGTVLPPAVDGAHILSIVDREVFTAYVPNEKGPVFMTLIGKTFGSDVTTRTWETVKKCAAA